MRCHFTAGCRGTGVRWAQFAFGHCLACDQCTKAHGGWREEDESDERPLCVAFPRRRVNDLI